MNTLLKSACFQNETRVIVNSLRHRSHKKAPPLKITFKHRKELIDHQHGFYRSRLADAEIEVNLFYLYYKAHEVMKKAKDFSPDDRVMVPEDTKPDLLNGVPEEHKEGRRVRIYMPTKPATQSGTHGTINWQIEFDNRERWENPLMGWSSTGDPLSNMSLKFPTAEKAQEFCEEQGWSSYIDQPNKMFLRPKSYGANFSWNKRTRRGTK